MVKRFVFLFLINIIYGWSLSPRHIDFMDIKEHFCTQEKLATTLSNLCKGMYNSPNPTKKSSKILFKRFFKEIFVRVNFICLFPKQ